MDYERPLDDHIESPSKTKFTRLALKMAVGAIVCFAIVIPVAIYDSGSTMNMIFGLLLIFGVISLSIGGFVVSILSFVKKEKDSALKVFVLIINIFLFIVVMGLIAFIITDLFMLYQ